MAALDYPGPYCLESGILTDALLTNVHSLPVLEREVVNKGIVLELNAFRMHNNIAWDVFDSWLKHLCPTASISSLSAMKIKISRIEKVVKELKRNKKNEKAHEISLEPFFGAPANKAEVKVTTSSKLATSNAFEVDALALANKKLAVELASTQKCYTLEVARTDELTETLSKLSVRNVNKKLKRIDDMIARLKEQIKERGDVEAELERAKKVSKHHQVNLSNARKRIVNVIGECNSLSEHAKQLSQKAMDIKSTLDFVGNERDCLLQHVKELESQAFVTKEHQKKYLDNVRQCCMELLALNVGIKNVDPIIRCVLRHIASIEVKELPHSSSLVRMLAEMKGLACQQLAEELSKEQCVTLHSDGTSKYGQHYYSFQISTYDSAYSLGLTEMLTGSTSQVLHIFKQILSDLELVAGPLSGSILLSKIKNTMSDHHIVEKKFNELLEDYRCDILPTVIESWETMTPDEQSSMSTLNNFFCGMHVLVGMADAASSALLRWEISHFNGATDTTSCVIRRKGESGIVCLVRTACKALSKHGSEQSGVYQSFTSYLVSNGIKRNPLAPFRGNRFNILFYDAGVLFYISDFVISFF